MSIHSLIEKGVDVFSYIPDVDSFQGNYKKLKYAWNGENNKFPTLSKDHVVADHLNYAIRPSFKFVDLDFDCELAVNWVIKRSMAVISLEEMAKDTHL